MAAVPTPATVTPAIWGLVRTGVAAAAGAARVEDEAAAATELVGDVDVAVVGLVYSSTPPDVAFVVRA